MAPATAFRQRTPNPYEARVLSFLVFASDVELIGILTRMLLNHPALVRCLLGSILGMFVLGSSGARAEELAEVEGHDPIALRTQAIALEHGEGVGRDIDLAMRLYCEGARLGDSESQYRLGWIYANGRGVKRDDTLASYFFSLAARQGNVDAERMLKHVGDQTAPVPGCMIKVEEAEAAPEADPAGELRHMGPAKIVELVNRLAPQYGVIPRLALAVIRTESNFDSFALSPKKAQGLMQLIPETATRFNVRKPFDPEQNVRGGLAYLRWLLAYYKGNVALVAAAYNAGEGAVNRFRGIPPFAETHEYVRRIRDSFRNDHHPYDPSVTEPSPEMPRIRLRLR